MKKELILIGCSKSKLNHRRPAYLFYTGDLFQKQMSYAENILLPLNNYKSDIMILSAKHGLIGVDKLVEPYDMSLNNFNAFERGHWARRVESQIYDLSIDYDNIIFLAGKNYREPLGSFLPYKTEQPLKGLGIGEQKQFIKNALDNRKPMPIISFS